MRAALLELRARCDHADTIGSLRSAMASLVEMLIDYVDGTAIVPRARYDEMVRQAAAYETRIHEIEQTRARILTEQREALARAFETTRELAPGIGAHVASIIRSGGYPS